MHANAHSRNRMEGNVLFNDGARCSSVVRAFAHGPMGRRIDPSLSYFSSSQCFTTGGVSCLCDGAYKRTLAANRKE